MLKHLKRDHIADMISVVVFIVYMNSGVLELTDNFYHIRDRSHNQKSQGMQEHLKRDHIAGMISVIVFNVFMNSGVRVDR